MHSSFTSNSGSHIKDFNLNNKTILNNSLEMYEENKKHKSMIKTIIVGLFSLMKKSYLEDWQH